MRDRRGRSLGRSDARVRRGSDSQTRLGRTGQGGRGPHAGGSLLVGETKLQTIGTRRRTPVGDVARGTGGGDGHGGFSGVIGLGRGSRDRGRGGGRGGRGAIDDGDARRLGLLHGLAAHRRWCRRLPMVRRAAHGDGSGGGVRRGLLGGTSVGGARRRRGRRRLIRGGGGRRRDAGLSVRLNVCLGRERCH